MKTNTSFKILEYLARYQQATAKDLGEYLEISRQALFKHLSRLQKDNLIEKIGRPPKVYYLLNIEKVLANLDDLDIDSKTTKYINENYLIITPTGKRKVGIEGFAYWCDKNKLPVVKTVKEYIQTVKKYNKFRRLGLINGLDKIKNTFTKCYLDKLFYLDFYSIERFGKTKLGQLLLHAKNSGDKKLIKEVVEDIKPQIKSVIAKYKIEAVGFIPATVPRQVQFMKELEKQLAFKKPVISITKVKTDIIVAQKTLKKLDERIENVKNTLMVDEKNKFGNILLIDDAVGSGATLNEVAKQIKSKRLNKNIIIGLAITGSYKGFEVISEV
jgi:sugar-specific transcriptional regulator TrmB